MRILIIGGYGVFGERLARLLNTDTRIHLLIGGRHPEKAQRLIQTLTIPGAATAVRVDLDELDTAFAQSNPDFVIHCAGPFQQQDYRVVRAAIDARIGYADLSDGRAFCEGFSALNDLAINAGVFAITALSTTTALTSAVASTLEKEFSEIESVRIGITPGNRAPRGRAVVNAILGYVGENIPARVNGEDTVQTGWGRLYRLPLAGLGRRWFSPCDAPDIAVMRVRYPEATSIEFLAGLELGILHLPLYVLARFRRRRLVPNLALASNVFHGIASAFEPFGSDCGGMFAEMTGVGIDGLPTKMKWTLVAKGGDGPYIPAMASAALVRKLASGWEPEPGARIANDEISLSDFEKEFLPFSITTSVERANDRVA